jgi:hypothetical protein
VIRRDGTGRRRSSNTWQPCTSSFKKTRKKKEQREKVAAEKPRGIACIIAHCTAGILMVFSEQIVLPTYTCNRSPYTHACPDANNERYFCFVRLLPAGGLQVSRQARDFHGTATIARERERVTIY